MKRQVSILFLLVFLAIGLNAYAADAGLDGKDQKAVINKTSSTQASDSALQTELKQKTKKLKTSTVSMPPDPLGEKVKPSGKSLNKKADMPVEPLEKQGNKADKALNNKAKMPPEPLE